MGCSSSSQQKQTIDIRDGNETNTTSSDSTPAGDNVCLVESNSNDISAGSESHSGSPSVRGTQISDSSSTIGKSVTSVKSQDSVTCHSRETNDNISLKIAKTQEDDLKTLSFSTEKLENISRESEPSDKIQTHQTVENTQLAEMAELVNNKQEKFHQAVKLACLLTTEEQLLDIASDDVMRLQLTRSLPHTFSVFKLITNLSSLQILDISGNLIGPQAFRVLLLSLCDNSTILSLNIANNQTDTDSALAVGQLLEKNKTLVHLDISGNYLGKDYLSRCAGPAMAKNTSLKVLKCESVGSCDMTVLTENLRNSSLEEVYLGHNQLSDGNVFVSNLTSWLQNKACALRELAVQNCGLQGDDLPILKEGLCQNTTLQKLCVSANQVSHVGILMDFVTECIKHRTLVSLVACDIKYSKKQPWNPETNIPGVFEACNLTTLHISGCSLTDDLLTKLATSCQLALGCLSKMNDLDISNNPELTSGALQQLHILLQQDNPSNINKLNLGLCNIQNIAGSLTRDLAWKSMTYLNLRKSSIGPAGVASLSPLVKQVSTLVLDGIKLSGTDALDKLLADCDIASGLVALSLGGCQLADVDLNPLCAAICKGLPLQMLKLSANRLGDGSAQQLVDSLVSHKKHPLELIDLMNNTISGRGAETLSRVYCDPAEHVSCIHSLNLSHNVIDATGACALLAHISKSPGLVTLQLSNQKISYEEEDLQIIYTQLATTLEHILQCNQSEPLADASGRIVDLMNENEYHYDQYMQSTGFKVTESNGEIVRGESKLPEIIPGLSVKLTGLGGTPGDIGDAMDSAAIVTDKQKRVIKHLSLDHALQIAAALKYHDSESCVMSLNEWRQVTDADKQAPSWLMVDELRQKAVYLSHLPASVTTQKMVGLLESEADCDVQEVFLCKDVLTRKNNGFGWVLMANKESVDKAMQLMHDSEAVVFSQPFLISRINVEVDDQADAQATQARHDIELRQAEMRRENVAHRNLLQESYEESQARHAYRLAHPAYADGRIW